MAIPSRSGRQDELSYFLREAQAYPLLDAKIEVELARRWRDQRDPAAADQLVGSHLRLVVKLAKGFQGYGLPLSELVAEGNLGLMQAVDKFDPERGFRLSTYAIWWIRAALQEYVLHATSLVKLATTSSRKKLFFNLRRAKARFTRAGERSLTPEAVAAIAADLNVPEKDVIDVNNRMEAADQSLNAVLGTESSDEWQDLLVDETPDQESRVADAEELGKRRDLMSLALAKLNERERYILTQRRLQEDPPTLEILSKQFQISRERVRQIEVRAFEKLQAEMTVTWERRAASPLLPAAA